MLFLSDLVDYFRGLCEVHPDLLHDEASGSRVFEVRSLEEVFSNLRGGGQEKTYLVHMALPTMSLNDQSDNAVKGYQVGLLIAKWHGTREASKTQIIEAMTDAEKVADSFVAQMILDSRNGHPLFFGRADRASGLSYTSEFMERVGDASYSGVFFMFELATFRCLTSDPTAEFPDGGTPFPQTSELKKLPLYLNQQAAADAGLAVGDFYVLDNGTDAGVAGQVMRVMEPV